LTFGPDGNLYVVGTGDGQVLRFNGSTGAPDGQPQPLIQNSVFTTSPAPMSGAQGIVFGSDGNIYVTNANNVSQFNGTTGVFIQNFTLTGSGSNPFFTGIAVGPDGKLYVSDQNGSPLDPFHDSVLKLDVTNILNPFSTYVAGGHAVNGDPSNPLNAPTGITFGSDGNLYIAAHESPAIGGRVLRFSGTSGALDTFVGNGSGGLDQPQGLVFGPDGNLYVASSFHNPPPGTPVTNSFVARYNGSTGAFIDQFAQGNSSDSFFGVAFPTLTAIPEAGTFAIGGAISLALVFHLVSRKRNRTAA